MRAPTLALARAIAGAARALPLPAALKWRLKSAVFSALPAPLPAIRMYRNWWLARENVETLLGLRPRRQALDASLAGFPSPERGEIPWAAYARHRARLGAALCPQPGRRSLSKAARAAAWFAAAGPEADAFEAVDDARFVAYLGQTLPKLPRVTRARAFACQDAPWREGPLETGAAASSASPRFSILTLFFRHLGHFEACAGSVDLLAARSPDAFAEWLVVNDDPGVSPGELLSRIPARLRPRARLVSDGRNLGIARRHNQAIDLVAGEWTVFLDCDDLVMPHALEVLGDRIAREPTARYLSSAMIDIDEHGHVFRYRRRTVGPESLLSLGMTAGHLKAIRTDALREYRFLEGVDGCQDYELALRMSEREELLFLPDFLYAYRWHSRTQSVSQNLRQELTTEVILQRFFLQRAAGGVASPAATPPQAAPGAAAGAADGEVAACRIFAIVATDGSDAAGLRRSVSSALLQWSGLECVVVVAGGEPALEAVRRDLAAELAGAVRLVAAPDMPADAAWLAALSDARVAGALPEATGIVPLRCGDVLYPGFGAAMAEALAATDADVICARGNTRREGRHAQAGASTFPSALMLLRECTPPTAPCIRLAALKQLDTARRGDDGRSPRGLLLGLLAADRRFLFLSDTLSESWADGGEAASGGDSGADALGPAAVEAARAMGLDAVCRHMLDAPLQEIDGPDAERLAGKLKASLAPALGAR
ncbi:glycosyltransferase [Burkholderiaceae bacterium FT117]|uniref:glycosyltransferase n=1 Tax=Zeimonas sediminis TaxID=2944268 RepID=UPI0023430808|nr:glycosyltransferase [Zeimonas sediminis]MCM5572375.1 glycosyltransferase [Zeimonas sediminis]